MKLTVDFKAVGLSTTTLPFSINPCPTEVADEIEKSLKQELPQGELNKVMMKQKDLAKLEKGLAIAIGKLADRHSGKDDLIEVTLRIIKE